MAAVPTLGSALPALDSCLQGCRASPGSPGGWPVLKRPGAEGRYLATCGTQLQCRLARGRAPQRGQIGAQRDQPAGGRRSVFQVWKVPRNPSPRCCRVMCSVRICFWRQCQACWLLFSSLLAPVWWRAVFSHWMVQATCLPALQVFTLLQMNNCLALQFGPGSEAAFCRRGRFPTPSAMSPFRAHSYSWLLAVYYTCVNACPGIWSWFGFQRWYPLGVFFFFFWHFTFPWCNLNWMGSVPQGTAG